METSFYSQNALRFYPFDEEQMIAERSAYSECVLDVVRQGIVDLGVVVIDGDNYPAQVSAIARISTGRIEVMVMRDVKTYTLVFTFDAPTTDFVTLKASGASIYGYLVLGLAPVWQRTFTDVTAPVFRECVKLVTGRKVTSVRVRNKDRWLPEPDCVPAVVDRPVVGEWCYGAIEKDELILRPGYNCNIRFGDGAVSIGPVPLGGQGAVARSIPLGWDGSGQLEPTGADGVRHDGLSNSVQLVRSLAGAYGEHIRLTHDNNFISEVHRRDSLIGGACSKDVLEITYVREVEGECIPLFTELFADLDGCRLILPETPLAGRIFGAMPLDKPVLIAEAPFMPLRFDDVIEVSTEDKYALTVDLVGLRFLPKRRGDATPNHHAGLQWVINYQLYQTPDAVKPDDMPEEVWVALLESAYLYYDGYWDIFVYGELAFRIKVSMEGSYGKYALKTPDRVRKWKLKVEVRNASGVLVCEEERDVERGDWKEET